MAYRRANLPDHERVPCSLVVDECQNFVTQSMVDILNEARKYRLFMTLSQLVAGQRMPVELRESLLQNTNMQIIGGTTDSGTKRNAELVSVEPSEVLALETGDFLTRPKRNKPALKFRTRTELLKFRNSVTNPIWALTIKEQIERYYEPYTTVTNAIEDEEDPDITPQ